MVTEIMPTLCGTVIANLYSFFEVFQTYVVRIDSVLENDVYTVNFL